VRGFGRCSLFLKLPSPRTHARDARSTSPLRGEVNACTFALTRLPLPYGERVGARGFGRFRKCFRSVAFQRVAYDLWDTIDILHYVVVPETKNQITHRLQNPRSALIIMSTNGMLTAVEFDNEMCISAEEIDDETVNRELPSKFPAAETAIAQPKPQNPFGVCLIAT